MSAMDPFLFYNWATQFKGNRLLGVQVNTNWKPPDYYKINIFMTNYMLITVDKDVVSGTLNTKKVGSIKPNLRISIEPHSGICILCVGSGGLRLCREKWLRGFGQMP